MEEETFVLCRYHQSKDKPFLITEKGNESSFLKEIQRNLRLKKQVNLMLSVVEKYLHYMYQLF
jgi:hypothetical protein